MVARMLRMFRVRGKRLWYLAFAAFATFLIFRLSHRIEPILEFDIPLPPKKGKHSTNSYAKSVGEAIPTSVHVVDEVKETTSEPVVDIKPTPTSTSSPSPLPVEKTEASKTPLVVVEDTSTSTYTPPTIPDRILPNKQKGAHSLSNHSKDEHIHPSDQKGRKEVPIFSATNGAKWESQVEHFPVPTESIIQLPTGEPVRIPKIQFNFKDETPDAKINRETRQAKVKIEFQRAWKGYRDNAWLHDELSPVTGTYRDPFCGWAATLVDGLDTLWIMGMETEFEEAAKAVGTLDFTTSPRSDIPMFETTIRYLGGMISAYDVSGKRYKVLLDKAVELADVMMGAFDTPNRMPILFYQWAPEFASQAHRASMYANTAELGSMSMEFTRLAQLTQEPRYYDAVARITNALSEWQDRGTMLAGVFPDSIDASGCNRTEVSTPVAVPEGGEPVGKSDGQPEGYRPPEPEMDVEETKPKVAPDTPNADVVELEIIQGHPSKAKIVDKSVKQPSKPNVQLEKRGSDQERAISKENDSLVARNSTNPFLPLNAAPLQQKSFKTPSRVKEDWDCRPQGLEPSRPSGMNKFSMGGGQDSTYEYMPKQYLLLGGHEQKYGKMYLKSIEAVRKHMLFRPMIPGNRDVLFSGAVEVSGDIGTLENLIPEVEHLTCFIGGMIGMAAKIFDLDGDLELAKELTDGCVWAYEAFATGIMPEGARVLPCEDRNNCTWDEKAYRLALDPMGEARDQLAVDYLANKAKAEAVRVKAEAARVEAARKAKADAVAAKEAAEAKKKAQAAIEDEDETASKSAPTGLPTQHEKSVAGDELKVKDDPIGSDSLKKEEPISLHRRDIEQSQNKEGIEQKVEKSSLEEPDLGPPLPKKSEPRPNQHLKDPSTVSSASNTTPGSSERKPSEEISDESSNPLHNIPPAEREYDDFVRVNEVASGREAEVPITEKAVKPNQTLPDPLLPLTHEQYVDTRISDESLPPGFTDIRARKYILRPEAIESVWYMYRITGDTIWQEKGWKMFEAVIKATSVKFGHSAIYDVTVNPPLPIDEMESFWLAETLKYYYLLFSTPDTISLDEWVLNTEAHPFRRPEV